MEGCVAAERIKRKWPPGLGLPSSSNLKVIPGARPGPQTDKAPITH